MLTQWTAKGFMMVFCLTLICLFGNSSPLLADTAGEDRKMPAGFIDVREIVPTVVVDMRYFTDHNFVGTKIDGYHSAKCILTEKAARALAGVQAELERFSLSLKVYDCYRPQRAVNHFVKWAGDPADTKTKREFYSTVEKKNLFRDGYIADRSSHSRGSTVDLTIVPLPLPAQERYVSGQPLAECFLPAGKRLGDNSLDMGTDFDCFHALSQPDSKTVGPQQRANRMLLKTLMEKHGFKPYDREWWHFTLKDEPYPDRYFDFAVE